MSSAKKKRNGCDCGKRSCNVCRSREWHRKERARLRAERAEYMARDIPDVVAWSEQNGGPQAPHSSLSGEFTLAL